MKPYVNQLALFVNVAENALINNMRAQTIKERCDFGLDLLSRIAEAEMASEERYDLLMQIPDGNSSETIDNAIKEKELV